MGSIAINLDSKQLVNNLLMDSSREDAFEIIKEIDDSIAEYDFTERLRDHFTRVIEKEDAAEDYSPYNKHRSRIGRG